MAVTINSYADLQNVLNAFVSAAGVTPGLAPHGVFWENLTYQQFTTGQVPGVPGFQIVTPGTASTSAIVMALSGTPNTPFDPNTGSIGQMPQPNAPYNAGTPSQSDVIAALSAWIENKCPEFGNEAEAEEARPDEEPAGGESSGGSDGGGNGAGGYDSGGYDGSKGGGG